MYIIVSSTILFNAIGMEWLFKGLEYYSYITKRSIVFKTIAVVAMFFLIHDHHDYVWYGVLSIFAASASNVLNFFYARKFIGLKPMGGYCFRRHFKAVGIFFAMSCATTVYTNLDTVMLGHMKTDADVGLYNAAVRIKTILVSIITSLGSVLLPRASYYVENGKMQEFRRITQKALYFVLLISVPLAVYFFIFAPYGVFFLAGKQYTGSIGPMRIIMPTLVFIGLTNIMGIQVLVPTGREKAVLYSEIAGAAVDAILNILLIPKFAAAGAAAGTLTAEIVVLIVQYYVLRKEVRDSFKEFHYGRLIIALVASIAASVWICKMDFSEIHFQAGNLMVLLVSSICFFGVYFFVLLRFKESIPVEIMEMVAKRIRKE